MHCGIDLREALVEPGHAAQGGGLATDDPGPRLLAGRDTDRFGARLRGEKKGGPAISEQSSIFGYGKRLLG